MNTADKHTLLTELSRYLSTAKQATILQRAITAEMDAEVAEVKARFEKKIKHAADEADAAIVEIQALAEYHRKELLTGTTKSLQLQGHVLGWRDTPGAIKTQKGVTEKKLLARLQRSTRLTRLFTRSKPTLNKEAMLQHWSRFKGQLTKLGARLVKEENFFVELDVTATPIPEVQP